MQIVFFHPDEQIVARLEKALERIEFSTVLQATYEELAESGLMLDAAVVAAGNGFGIMDGGLDEAMNRAHGGAVQRLVQEQIVRRYGVELPVGCEVSVMTEDGQHIIYAPTMQIPMCIAGTDNVYRAARAAAHRAYLDGEEMLFMPLMGTGAGAMDVMSSVEQMLSGVVDGVGEPEIAELNWVHADQMHLKWHRFCGIADDGFRCAEVFGRRKADGGQAEMENLPQG